MPLSMFKKSHVSIKIKNPRACTPGPDLINLNYGIKWGGVTVLPKLQLMDGVVPTAA